LPHEPHHAHPCAVQNRYAPFTLRINQMAHIADFSRIRGELDMLFTAPVFSRNLLLAGVRRTLRVWLSCW
jgi:hypothetical protein